MADQVANDEQLAVLTQHILQLDDSNKNNDELTFNSSTAPNQATTSSQQQQHHWLVYDEEKTPEYIVEAKKRLNQIRQPNVAPNTTSLLRQVRISDEPVRVMGHEESERSRPASGGSGCNDNEMRHWLTWPNPSTPEKIREIRGRLGDDRYKRMAELKSMFKRPKTAYTVSEVAQSKENVRMIKTV